MSQDAFYPPAGGAGSNASVSTNGQPIPGSSTLVAGKNPSNNQTPVLTDAAGNLIVILGPSANTQAVNVAQLQGATPSATNSLPSRLTDGTTFYDARSIRALTSADVVTANQGGAWSVGQSGSWSILNITGTVSLPTGASTSALQTAGNTSLSSIDTKTPALVSGRVPVDGSGVIQPTSAPDVYVTGTITATDAVVAAPGGTGITVSGASTAGSLVAANTSGGCATYSLQISGTATGTYYVEASNDSTNGTNGTWIQLSMVRDGTITSSGGPTNGTVSAGVYRGSCAGCMWVRVRNVTGTAPNNGIILSLSSATNGVYLTKPLPPGTNAIGTVSVNNLPGTVGQKTMAASAAVVIASDQSTLPVSFGTPTALTVKSAGITVGTTAVRLTTDGLAPSATRRILMANVDISNTAKFYIGPSGVTAATGLQLTAGLSFSSDADAGDYYIISNTAAQTVFVLEQE